jgi:hypothetical protein
MATTMSKPKHNDPLKLTQFCLLTIRFQRNCALERFTVDFHFLLPSQPSCDLVATGTRIALANPQGPRSSRVGEPQMGGLTPQAAPLDRAKARNALSNRYFQKVALILRAWQVWE